MLKRSGARVALAGLATLVSMLALAAPGMAAETVFGLTANDRIVTFPSDKPGAVTPSVPIIDAATNLPITADVIGIDFRPATNRLYGIIKPAAATAQVVQLVFNPTNNIFVAARAPDPAAPTAPQALDGTVYGIDFNPLADRLRVHSIENDNVRFQPTTGALAATDPDLVFDDAMGDPAVTGTAYSKNQPGTNSTQLYGIDTTLDRVVTMQTTSPTFQTVTRRGPLGVDATGDVGFDISPRGDALAAIQPAASTSVRLYRVDLDQPFASTQPSAKDLGVISPAPNDSSLVQDITVQPNIQLFAALRPGATAGDPQTLSLFRGDLPEGLSAPRPITGIPAGTTLLGIDVRQADGELYAIGDDEVLYELTYDSNPAEVPAEAIGRIPTPTVFSGSTFGVDFNPLPDSPADDGDKLRVVSDTEQNLRLDPVAPGTPASGTTNGADTALTPDSSIVGAAYSNPFVSADTTTLFAINDTPGPGGALVTIGGPDGTPSPNLGAITPVGSLGSFVSPSSRTSYDIVVDNNLGYMATDIDAGAAESVLYTIGGGNTSTEAIPVGKLGGGGQLADGLAGLNGDTITLGSVSLIISEDKPVLPVILVRSGPADRAQQVKVSLQSLTATASFDFGSVQQTSPTGVTTTDPIVRFAPGETTKTVTIPIVDDTQAESSEAFFVHLFPPDVAGTSLNGARIGFPHEATAVIGDNDTAPAPVPTLVPTPGTAINGTAGNDSLTGTAGDDVIICGEGDDVVNAGGGNDVIICGGGNDEVNGGSGNDAIDGGSGNDKLNGGSGDDIVTSGTGNDRVKGGSGDDRVTGGSGNDRLRGNTGSDRLSGNSGKDNLAGGSGDDRLSGGSGNDRVEGNSGDDRASGGSGRDRVLGGSGRDRVSGGPGRDGLVRS